MFEKIHSKAIRYSHSLIKKKYPIADAAFRVLWRKKSNKFNFFVFSGSCGVASDFSHFQKRTYVSSIPSNTFYPNTFIFSHQNKTQIAFKSKITIRFYLRKKKKNASFFSKINQKNRRQLEKKTYLQKTPVITIPKNAMFNVFVEKNNISTFSSGSPASLSFNAKINADDVHD